MTVGGVGLADLAGGYGVAHAAIVAANPAGLDVERLLLTRDAFGCVDRAQLRAATGSSRWTDGRVSTPGS